MLKEVVLLTLRNNLQRLCSGVGRQHRGQIPLWRSVFPIRWWLQEDSMHGKIIKEHMATVDAKAAAADKRIWPLAGGQGTEGGLKAVIEKAGRYCSPEVCRNIAVIFIKIIKSN